MKLKDLKIGVKQTIGFVCILILMAGANFSSFYQLFNLKKSIDDVTNSWLPRAIAISEININTTDLRQNQLQLIFADSEAERTAQADRIVELLDSINTNLDTYERLRVQALTQNLYSEEERALFAAFDQKWDRYQELSFTFFQYTREDRIIEAVSLLNGEARLLFEEFRHDLQELVRVNTTDSQRAAVQAEDAFRTARRVAQNIFILTLIVSALAVFVTIRLITIPVKQLSSAVAKVAQGDLTVQLEHQSEDELGKLTSSFNRMTFALKEARAKTEEQELALRTRNTELQQTLAQLQEAQQQLIMKEKMASLGNLVAGVAHEINNPIGAVNSSADNARRAVLKLRELISRNDELRRLLGETELEKLLNVLDENTIITATASKRIAHIVKSLKSFARLDEADFQRASIEEGLETTLTLVQHEFKNRIEVVREYAGVPPILCFPNELNQVFMNLLVNASQAIHGKGQVVVKTAYDQNWAYIVVSDTGIGIPPSSLQRVFDPGFTTKGVGVGTGLGLSISYNIIKKHDGTISVTSTVGEGTEFTIKLPFRT